MASRSAARPLLRLSKPTVPRTYSVFRATVRAAPPQCAVARSTCPTFIPRPTTALQQLRRHSTPAQTSKVFEYDEIKALSDDLPEQTALVDVREPSEFADGYIPGALNIPVASQPDALLLPADEFEDRFGFEKPTADTEVVFYCKAGVRSSAAARLASQAGWTRVGEYRGSWLDWVAKGGKIERP